MSEQRPASLNEAVKKLKALRDEEQIYGLELIKRGQEAGLISKNTYRRLRQMLIFGGAKL